MRTAIAIVGLILAGTLPLCLGAGKVAGPSPTPSTAPATQPLQPMWKTKVPAKLTEAEYVFTGKLDRVEAGPVAMSMPPIYHHKLDFTVDKVLRGQLRQGQKVACVHLARQEKVPQFPVEKVCLVAAKNAQGSIQAELVEVLDAEKLTQATLACAVPLGWRVEEGKAVSPWAQMGKKAWAGEMAGVQDKITCSKTGRPALMAGEGVSFEIEPVPPQKAIQWTNPDGDGEYKITVTNTTDKPLSVPALLRGDGKVLWEESLVIICQDKAYPCPGCKGVSGKVEPAKLEPKQSVSTVVNVLALDGPEWPRGGYRIEFRFCLGEKSKTHSFYYMSRHHDKLREKAGKQAALTEQELDERYSRIGADMWLIQGKIGDGRYNGDLPLEQALAKLEAAECELRKLHEAYTNLDSASKTDRKIAMRFFYLGKTGFAGLNPQILVIKEQIAKEAGKRKP